MAFTVLTGELAHETNTFSIRKADYQAFAGRYVFTGEEAIAARGDANTGLAGFLDVCRAHGTKVIHTVSASAEPSGLVTADAFDRLVGHMVEGARRHKGQIDGVLLALHGAMVTEADEDGEGENLARLRAVLGPDLPIAMTLDLHANVTKRMCDLAQIIVSYKTYPHVDMREAGRHAAEILHRTMAGEIKPRTLRVHLPMLEEPNGCRTDIGPMIDWVARAREFEKRPDVFAVSINAGFAAADIKEVGATVLVTGQPEIAGGDQAPHRDFARQIAREMWAQRNDILNRYLTVSEAVAIAGNHDKTKPGGPLIIADYSDNPGAGAYGDSTALLRGMIDARLMDACFGPMIDPEAAAELHRHKPGAKVRVRLGGKTDPRIGGAPLDLDATLNGVYDGWYTGDGPMIGGLRLSYGPTAVIRVGGIDILVVSVPAQMRDLQQFRAFGIDPRQRTVVALKSQQHFRAAFGPIAGQIIVCDAGALSTSDTASFPYKNAPRPIFPLDPGMADPDFARL